MASTGTPLYAVVELSMNPTDAQQGRAWIVSAIEALMREVSDTITRDPLITTRLTSIRVFAGPPCEDGTVPVRALPVDTSFDVDDGFEVEKRAYVLALEDRMLNEGGELLRVDLNPPVRMVRQGAWVGCHAYVPDEEAEVFINRAIEEHEHPTTTTTFDGTGDGWPDEVNYEEMWAKEAEEWADDDDDDYPRRLLPPHPSSVHHRYTLIGPPLGSKEG